MFTGIVQATGHIETLQVHGNDTRVSVMSSALDLRDVSCGDSIAVSGVCLTVVEFNSSGFAVDVSPETLACTTFATLAAGDTVNLEKALSPTTRLSGHLVSGHVDGVGHVISLEQQGGSRRLRFSVPAALQRYIANKGSICIDGVSLTVNEVQGNEFSITVIPHTLQSTIMGQYKTGTAVNVEVDLIARYLERLITTTATDSAG